MARGAFEASLPRAAYVDEAFLEREREGIWWSEWVAVGREEQLPSAGDFLPSVEEVVRGAGCRGSNQISHRAARGGVGAKSGLHPSMQAIRLSH